ncbi:N-acetylglucosamine-binding protein GbpA [Pseudomonas sp. GV071]|uniref:N-acetylglucosamine-binding protein GbpA n=1 Tax=Pseudomonas sp. GV071 TaxID=2135754 RepID=UPI000D396E8B|nr:N-acetylglucosamine-binding protein GbpA [Pseudomonas sp. GV071]PTQ70917.1 chitin-binding protein [Pseudomonas sp. GV071]
MHHASPRLPLRRLPLLVAMGLVSIATQQAYAHGYVEQPKSRAVLCTATAGNLNSNCGIVAYEPQSIEYGPSVNHHYQGAYCSGDFTQCGPANETIAAGGMSGFGQLNEQSATRWTKHPIKPGANTFTWRYTAGHATSYHQFYITKKDWNPNQPLTRDSFELVPLLHQDAQGVRPPSGGSTSHTVNIPAGHSGYHVVLATWKIADTAATFYQVIDVNISGAANPTVPGAPVSTWKSIGTVVPEPLKIGDKVLTRVFTAQGEQSNRQTSLTIETDEQAQANTWPFLLAQKVAKANVGYSMGELNSSNEVVPNYGKNSLYTKTGSDVVRVEIQKVQTAPSNVGSLELNGLQASYKVEGGMTQLHFNALTQGGPYTVNATVFNAKGESIAHQQSEPGSSSPHMMLTLKKPAGGTYDLVVVAKPETGEPLQKTHRFEIEAQAGKYDFVFPNGLKSYKAGTKVLARDGNTYACKPFPYSGYCVQWSSSATQYEPGTGSHWQMAWTRQ